jgi:tRNA pseudouridine38-40 synthase
MLSSWKGEKPADGGGIPTIQETISRALGRVVRHPVLLIGSSRTDAGVHAKGQVAHFDTDQSQIPIEGIRMAANALLPGDIVIQEMEPVAETFDAIKSTERKRYQYFIWHAPNRPVFFHEMVWHRWRPIDVEAMREGAKALVGEHDFASFAKPGHGRESTVRRIYGLEVSQRGPRIVIGVEGGGFLWQMVRIIVGTLTEVGLGKYKAEDVKGMLEARDRKVSGSTAPAKGLFLQWIRMKPEAEWVRVERGRRGVGGGSGNEFSVRDQEVVGEEPDLGGTSELTSDGID